MKSKPKRKKLTSDQLRFNRVAASIKGKPGSVPYKRYIFGHMHNVKTRGK